MFLSIPSIHLSPLIAKQHFFTPTQFSYELENMQYFS